MKKLALSLIFALAAFLVVPVEAVTIKKSMTRSEHNYIATYKYVTDSLYVPSDDILEVLSDSATSTYMNSAAFRVRSLGAHDYDRLADSLVIAVVAFGDDSDAMDYELSYLVSLTGNGGTYYTLGGLDTVTLADETSTLTLKAREFIPDSHLKVRIKTITATDTVNVQQVKLYPKWR